MENNFNLYGKYYDLLYKQKDYDSEATYISSCIRQYTPYASKLLEFGSGTGRHGLILQKMGYEVFGLERSHQMVAEATQAGFRCQQADITSFQLDNKFDAVISLFHVISYLTENSELESTFRNAANCMNPGGLFIFDVWYSPAVYLQKPEARIKRVENKDLYIIRFAEPEVHDEINVVDVNYTVLAKEKNTHQWTEFHETHSMRHFTIPEIHFLADLSGFEILRTEEPITGNPPSAKTWGICFILRKK